MSIVNPSAPDSSVCIPVLHCALLSRVVYYEHPPMWWHSGVKISPQLLRRNVKFCYYFILLFLFFYSKSSTKRDISFHHKLGVQINIICIHKSNLAQFSVYPIYILECDRWDFPPPLIFNLKLKMLSLCANWKVFIYMKYGGINTIWAMLFY